MLALDKVSGKSMRDEGDLDWVVDIRKGGGQDVQVVLDILRCAFTKYDDVALQAATATRALSTRNNPVAQRMLKFRVYSSTVIQTRIMRR
jgi:hypothetical protein